MEVLRPTPLDNERQSLGLNVPSDEALDGAWRRPAALCWGWALGYILTPGDVSVCSPARIGREVYHLREISVHGQPVAHGGRASVGNLV